MTRSSRAPSSNAGEQQLIQEAQQNNSSPADLAERQKDLLRDMIDQQLLISKGKELGISGDAETVRQLDDLRKQNHLDSMEALEKAAGQQGISFEDFKANIRNGVITRQVVRDEVGRNIRMTRQQEQAYYAEHGKDFEVPESVHLSEILVPLPETATDAQIAQGQAKSAEIAAKIQGGMKFTDAAKQFSGGPSAAQGGDLGDFKRGALAKVLEDATFAQAAGSVDRADPHEAGLRAAAYRCAYARGGAAACEHRAAGTGSDVRQRAAAGVARISEPSSGKKRTSTSRPAIRIRARTARLRSRCLRRTRPHR